MVIKSLQEVHKTFSFFISRLNFAIELSGIVQSQIKEYPEVLVKSASVEALIEV